jgi:hypothetical protein
MVLELLINDPVWLNRRLDFGRPEDFAIEGTTGLLYFLRRYAAKFLYELELHSGAELATMQARYVERLSDALKLEMSGADYLADVHPGFYSSSYLRAWAFEAQLRDHLRSRFGSDWFRHKAAGDLLRELWSLGQSLRADDLLRELTGEPIRFEVLAAEARAALR